MELPIKELIIDKISGEWGEDAAFGEGVKVIRTANFTNLGIIDFTNLVYRNIDSNKIALKKLQPGDIIVEKSGGSPNQPVGRVVFFDMDTDEEYLCNNFTAILRPDSTQIHPKYLFYQLFIGHIRGKTLKYQNNTTGIINLELDNYLNEKINIPSLEEQTKIVAVLSKIEILITKCKECIKFSEEFLQSIFLELFGDPMSNENNWKMEVLGTYITSIKAGASYSGEEKDKLEDEELGVLKISAVTKGTFDPKEFKVVNKAKIKKNVIFPRKGDLLFSRANTRELVGATCIVDNDYPKLFLPDKLWKIELNENVLNKYYLHYLLQNRNFKSNLTKDATGSSGSMLNISMHKFQNLKCPIPEIKIQNKFSKFVTKTEVVKDELKACLLQLENLYGSISQSVYNGDIDVSKLNIDTVTKFTGGASEIRKISDKEKNKKKETTEIDITKQDRFHNYYYFFLIHNDEQKKGYEKLISLGFHSNLSYENANSRQEKILVMEAQIGNPMAWDILWSTFYSNVDSYNKFTFFKAFENSYTFSDPVREQETAELNRKALLEAIKSYDSIPSKLSLEHWFRNKCIEQVGLLRLKELLSISDARIKKEVVQALQRADLKSNYSAKELLAYFGIQFSPPLDNFSSSLLNYKYFSGLSVKQVTDEVFMTIPKFNKRLSEIEEVLIFLAKRTLELGLLKVEESRLLKWIYAEKVSPTKLTWDKVSFEQVANWIKEKYKGYYFSTEMLIRFLKEEHVVFPDYYSSEELKRHPQLNGADDIKSFIFSAISNENTFIKLEQYFYNAEKETFQLNVTEDDYELIQSREAKERSGIYFSIVE